MTFTKVGDIVDTVLEKHDFTKDTYSLFDIWEKELGKLTKFIKMVGRRNKTLLVKVDNPVYKQELRLRKKEFLNKINDHYGYIIVEDIKFV